MFLDLELLKAVRKAKGFTQEQMSELLGWKTRKTYAQRENGKIYIGADELKKIMIILGYLPNNAFFFLERSPKRTENSCFTTVKKEDILVYFNSD
ncbi:hypothetical protein IGI96_003599 [Enterococcus sp. DIV0421]|uniref:helix-turn-helix domain-containing protein n=1 Tax=Enterococcus sp. DIV0421 TaxID=2774688 RepID=UPI003F1E5B66